MTKAVLICILCALGLGIAAAGATTKPLPALRVAVSGWSAKSTYTIGETVTYRFAFRNRAHVRLKVVEARLTLPKGWTLIPTASAPKAFAATRSAIVWRYKSVPAAPSSVGRLVVTARVGGKPGSACVTQVVKALRPTTYARTWHGCNKVVDAVFH